MYGEENNQVNNQVKITIIRKGHDVDIGFTTKMKKDLMISRKLDQIDEALDAKNATLFAELTEELKLLNGGTPYALNSTTS